MPKKRKFTSVDDKCRVCLGDDGCMSDIFSEDIKPKIFALGESTSTHIYNDENLPRNICHVCLYKLDMWIEFKRQFLRSHEMLREHLGLAELVDNAASAAKRKHVEKSAKEDSPDVGAAKKMKLGEPAATDEADAKCKGDEKSQAGGELVSPDTLAKNISDNAELAEGKETSENATRPTRGASPTKQTSGRRGKTTERREASTKRWVARKRALLAATGENETDTDSETSDEAQLSPVRKARAKSNADKVAESQRRVAKSLRTFEDNDRQGSKEGDEDKEDGGSEVDEDSRDAKTIEKRKKEVEPDAARLEDARKNAAPNDIKDSTTAVLQTVSKNFLPHSIRSELTIDEATFIVTSTLVLQEPHHLSPVSLPQLPKENAEPVVPSAEDANQEQRNTDIIDAVQLRRVPPKSPAPSSDRKYLERCLNIEVEGTELEALQRVQSDLAVFVETKLLRALDVGTSSKPDDEAKNPSQSLDQQLKTIVEKSIKRNLENTRIERASACENRGNNTFTGDFVKAAMRSRIFQPRVLLVRYEDRGIKENSQVNEPKLGKRRSIIPAKFADYDGSPFNTASDEPKEPITRKTDPPSSKLKAKAQPAKLRETEPPAQANSTETAKGDPPSVSIDKNQSLDKSVQPDEKSASPSMSAPPLNNSVIAEKHICGVCGESFGTRREVEIHFSAHKVAPPVVTIRQVKPKMMRCKRCHEIVEAGYVRLHVCNSPRNNKCRVCEATFRSEKLLAKHLETHGDEDKPSEIEPSAPTAEVPNVEPSSALVPTSDTTPKKHPLRDSSGPPGNDTYTCFVCDKIFEGEQVLKDHLQKHCDDISEEDDEDDEDEDDDDDDDDDDDEVARDEPSVNDKELYQCAICGESLQSEDALESHVEKHLFDDEDDNPNLISIVERQDERTMRNKERNVHGCDQCDETFDSEMLLMLHVQAHEEEVAIAEWERRGVDDTREEQHTCVICDEVFATEAELSEHLDVHNGNAHVCQLCDKPFLTLEELRAHVDTH